MALRLPCSVENGRSRLSIDQYDDYSSSKLGAQCYRLSLRGEDGQGWYTFLLSTMSMRAFADLLYRACDETPRDVGHAVRVVLEHVAAVPPAAPAPVERTPEEAEKEAIKLRLMR